MTAIIDLFTTEKEEACKKCIAKGEINKKYTQKSKGSCYKRSISENQP